jgi:hypothetical protein
VPTAVSIAVAGDRAYVRTYTYAKAGKPKPLRNFPDVRFRRSTFRIPTEAMAHARAGLLGRDEAREAARLLSGRYPVPATLCRSALAEGRWHRLLPSAALTIRGRSSSIQVDADGEHVAAIGEPAQQDAVQAVQRAAPAKQAVAGTCIVVGHQESGAGP